MSPAIIVSICGVLLSLLVSVFGGLAVVWKVGTLVGRTLSAIERFEERSKAWDTQTQAVPLMAQRLDVLEQTVTDELRRLRSDIPPMRAKFDSVNEDVEELKDARIPERLAILESKTTPPRPAMRPPQMGRLSIPRKDNEE
jgi:hypothetical protein